MRPTHEFNFIVSCKKLKMKLPDGWIPHRTTEATGKGCSRNGGRIENVFRRILPIFKLAVGFRIRRKGVDLCGFFVDAVPVEAHRELAVQRDGALVKTGQFSSVAEGVADRFGSFVLV